MFIYILFIFTDNSLFRTYFLRVTIVIKKKRKKSWLTLLYEMCFIYLSMECSRTTLKMYAALYFYH